MRASAVALGGATSDASREVSNYSSSLIHQRALTNLPDYIAPSMSSFVHCKLQ
jgi:hypothetical protein